MLYNLEMIGIDMPNKTILEILDILDNKVVLVINLKKDKKVKKDLQMV